MGMRQPLQKPPGYRDQNAPMNRPMPPPGTIPSTYRPVKKKQSSHSCCRIFCCCFFITTIMLILLIVSIGGLLYVWFQPRYPQVHFTSLDSNKFEITNTNAGPTLKASSDIQVELWNPNKNLRVQYDTTKISIHADDADNTGLGDGTVRGFIQERRNVTKLNVTASVDNEILDQKSAGSLVNNFKNKDLKASAVVKTSVAFIGNGWNTGMVPITVICSGFRFGEEVDNVQPRCHIQILNLFYIN